VTFCKNKLWICKGEEKGYGKMREILQNEVNFIPARRRRRLTRVFILLFTKNKE